MRFLLDTHTFIWWDTDASKLSRRAHALCSDPMNTMVFSLASAWEMQIKIQLGKLKLAMSLDDMIDIQHRANGVEILPVSLPHILELSNIRLLPDHKDPFDRIIIAQATVENIPLVSTDSAFSHYPITVLW